MSDRRDASGASWGPPESSGPTLSPWALARMGGDSHTGLLYRCTWGRGRVARSFPGTPGLRLRGSLRHRGQRMTPPGPGEPPGRYEAREGCLLVAVEAKALRHCCPRAELAWPVEQLLLPSRQLGRYLWWKPANWGGGITRALATSSSTTGPRKAAHTTPAPGGTAPRRDWFLRSQARAGASSARHTTSGHDARACSERGRRLRATRYWGQPRALRVATPTAGFQLKAEFAGPLSEVRRPVLESPSWWRLPRKHMGPARRARCTRATNARVHEERRASSTPTPGYSERRSWILLFPGAESR